MLSRTIFYLIVRAIIDTEIIKEEYIKQSENIRDGKRVIDIIGNRIRVGNRNVIQRNISALVHSFEEHIRREVNKHDHTRASILKAAKYSILNSDYARTDILETDPQVFTNDLNLYKELLDGCEEFRVLYPRVEDFAIIKNKHSQSRGDKYWEMDGDQPYSRRDHSNANHELSGMVKHNNEAYSYIGVILEEWMVEDFFSDLCYEEGLAENDVLNSREVWSLFINEHNDPEHYSHYRHKIFIDRNNRSKRVYRKLMMIVAKALAIMVAVLGKGHLDKQARLLHSNAKSREEYAIEVIETAILKILDNSGLYRHKALRAPVAILGTIELSHLSGDDADINTSAMMYLL